VRPLAGLETERAAADHVVDRLEAAGRLELERRAERVAGGEPEQRAAVAVPLVAHGVSLPADRLDRWDHSEAVPDDVTIEKFLGSLGLAGRDAECGRAILQGQGVTNPRKSRIWVAKVERAAAAIDAALARYCSSCADRTDPGGRELVTVAASACSRCGGSRNRRALSELAEACAAAGIARIVVVGGSPDVRRELESLRGALELRLVDGTERRTRPEAQRDLAWADLAVICGGSELAHRVSILYTEGGASTPVVTCPRRGVEAIAGAVVEHAARRGRALPS
ncbi:MAG: hypothetical protein V7644_2703, partial [Actinomycetota bacterium]